MPVLRGGALRRPIWKTTSTSARSAATTNRLKARERLDLLLDAEGRFEIGAEVLPVDALKFKDSRRYPERLADACETTGETDSLVVMQGAIKTIPVVAAVFEFDFMGGSMARCSASASCAASRSPSSRTCPFICVTASGGARMQEGPFR